MAKLPSKLLAFLLFSAAFLSATTTVTGNVRDLGAATVSRATVRFYLRGCAGNQPRVTGIGALAPSQGSVWFKDFVSDASGNISGTLYSTRDAAGTGNGEIECGGSYTAVWYGMQLIQAGKTGPEVAIVAKNTATLDISSITPITTNPVIAAPTGDGTYLRLDGGNSPVTGVTNFSAGIMAASINTTVYVGGSIAGGGDIGSQLNAAYAALPSTGGRIGLLSQAGGGCYSFSTPIVFGTSGKYVSLVGVSLGNQTGNINQGACLNYTPTTATTALTLDYSPATGGGFTAHTSLENIVLINNGCATTGGCGSSATGIKTGTTNGGVHFGSFRNIKVSGFSTGINFADTSGVGWEFHGDNISAVFNNIGIVFTTVHEQMNWSGGAIASNATGLSCPTASDATFTAVSFDNNSTVAISNAGGNLTLTGPHFENSGGATVVQYLTQSSGNVSIYGGFMLDDNNSGTVAQHITTTGGFVQMYGMTLFSGGQTITNILNNSAGGAGDINYSTLSPTLTAPGSSATCALAYNCAVKRITGATQQVSIPAIFFPFTGAGAPSGVASNGLMYYDASANRIRMNNNNAGADNVLGANSTDTVSNKIFTTIGTATNCSAVGSAANPSIANCGSAAAGHFSCDPAATGGTCHVNTTAVTTGSEIFVFESATFTTGSGLGVTCNTSTAVLPANHVLSVQTGASGFTINLGTVTTNPACFSYLIVN